MSPRRARRAPAAAALSMAQRAGVLAGSAIRAERARRRWTLRALAEKAGVSHGALHDAEAGHASLEMYARLGHALGLRLEVGLVDPRRRVDAARGADLVHSAMGELEATHLRGLGFETSVDEPYQHYQFAGRADVIAWSASRRALLHIENRTQFPDLQDAAGSYNAKRAYLPQVFAERIDLHGGFVSVTHVIVALWSAEVIHAVRLRGATFRSLCPDPITALESWWSGDPPERGQSSTFALLDPTATGRQRLWLDLGGTLDGGRPRFRGYADAADRLKAR